MTPEEVIRFLKNPDLWGMKQHPLQPNTPEQGLSVTFKEVVKKQSMAYASLSGKSIANLRPLFMRDYFYALTDVIRTGALEGEEFWKSIIPICAEMANEQSSTNYKQYESALLGLLGLIEEGLNKGRSQIPVNDDNLKKTYEINKTLLKYSHGSDIDGTDSYNPYTGSLNCVQGKSLGIILRLAMKAKNEIAELFDSFFKERTRNILNWSINEGKKPRVISVIGAWFIHVLWLDIEWTEKNLDVIFDEKKNDIWNATWNSYLLYGRTSEEAFKFLLKKKKYEIGLNLSLEEEKKGSVDNILQRLVDHIMMAFFNLWIDENDSLLSLFWQRASNDLKAHAIEFLSTGFRDLKEREKYPDKKDKIITRLLNLWKARLDAARKNPKASIDEIKAFVSWLEDCPFDPKKALEMTKQTLDLTEGRLDNNHVLYQFADAVGALGIGNELLAIECLTLAGDQKDNQTTGFSSEPSFSKFLDHIVKLPDDYKDPDKIRKAAIDMANVFGRRNVEMERFRKLYEELSKKN